MSLPTNPIRSTNLFMLLLASLLLAAPLSAITAPPGQAGPDQATTEVAVGQLSGTTLTVTPQIGYFERAVLRVSGPEHYALTRRFETNASISADLLREGAALADSHEDGEVLNALPRGRYRYEVVFHAGSTNPKAHTGTFRYPQ